MDLNKQAYEFAIDPVHAAIDFANDPLIADVTRDKYLQKDEDFNKMTTRVGASICGTGNLGINAINAMRAGLWMPAGRILSGAGTKKAVTLMNCYVNQTIEDSMKSILDGNTKVGLTLQQGGGIGTGFSKLRPKHARLKRTGEGSAASGPIPFMRMYNGTSLTVKSAGDRRGAMMGTLIDTHPDLPYYITVKQTKGELEQFNISILVSDAFMHCVAMDEDWLLYFHVPPVHERSPILQSYDFEDEDGVKQYVYSVWRARELWDMITRNTYEWSEPGVIFIDRVNDLNNLYYCEEIDCTNPCGEQPLPPDGACNLGAINLMRLVRNPFTRHAEIDEDMLVTVARLGTRFLDKVIDVSGYPFPEQQQEQINKRRIGLGISGLGTMLAQLMERYGSPRSVHITEHVMQTIAVASYEESALMAQESGAFPLFDKDKYLASDFVQKLPKRTRDMIGDLGARNGVNLTIAPTGTTSITFGNGSSGLEPDFAYVLNRNVHQADDTFKKYENVESYTWKLFKHAFGNKWGYKDELPEFMVTAQELSIMDHLRIQAACQKWVDASVSKTINIPTDTPFEEFQNVYMLAYQMGCKGCTTYRYSEVRGSILSVAGEEKKAEPVNNMAAIRVRPEELEGTTYRIKWPSWSASLYMTITHDEDGKPFECFIQSKDARHQEWITALTLMISAIFRKGGDVTFVPAELKQIYSTHDVGWANGKMYPSLVARIAEVLEQHLRKLGLYPEAPQTIAMSSAVEGARDVPTKPRGELCMMCDQPTMIREEGCKKCTNCGYSSCG